MTTHIVIPDVQLRPGDDTNFLRRIGEYIVQKRPEVIVCLGDFADLPSLSSYDVGKKSFEGRRYRSDIEAVREGMRTLLLPLEEYNANQRKNGKKLYRPRKVLTLGNHCNRIERAIENDPKLDGTIGLSDLQYEEFGWEVHPFLEVVVIDGVAYSHYFTSGPMGRPVGTASALLTKKHMSCVAGHLQGRSIATATRADGTMMTAIIAGSCYEHLEAYLGPQGNKHYRGLIVLHEVSDGSFDEMFVSLTWLNRKYS